MRLALLVSLLCCGCSVTVGGGEATSPRTQSVGAPRLGDPTPAPPTARRIVVAGREVPIEAPVVTWLDPGGFNGYLETCFFQPQRALPRSPAGGCDTPKRYASRRNLEPALAEVVADRGWTPDLAALQIDQVVVHYDVAWTSQNCFNVLHDMRGLSCHFLLDVDGTLYQTLDVVERARHGGKANDRSIGIEIAHPGVLELTPALSSHYRDDGRGVVFDLGPRATQVRTPGFVVRPARAGPLEGEVQGTVYTQYDFTEAQYQTLVELLAQLARALPRIQLQAPLDSEGRLRTRVLPDQDLAAFSGVLGHFHASSAKQDPGPAFDWERVLSQSRVRLAQLRSAAEAQ
jgi:N-acetyl-anhydromuramyl-L-alanine amidase AmpD